MSGEGPDIDIESCVSVWSSDKEGESCVSVVVSNIDLHGCESGKGCDVDIESCVSVWHSNVDRKGRTTVGGLKHRHRGL